MRGEQRTLHFRHYCSPGNPKPPGPPVIFVISDCASALPCSIACFTPLSTTSSRNSTSFGSTISLSILIESTSPAPFAITVTLPPPALTSTVFSSSSAWVLAICSCIFCACFINLFRFIMFGSGFDFAFEHFERFLDERIILELVGLPRRVIVRTLARQSFLRAQLRCPIAAADFFEQSFKLAAVAGGGERFNGRFLFRRITEKKVATFDAKHRQRINQRAQKSFRRNFRADFSPNFCGIDNRIRFRRVLRRRFRYASAVAGVVDPGLPLA